MPATPLIVLRGVFNIILNWICSNAVDVYAILGYHDLVRDITINIIRCLDCVQAIKRLTNGRVGIINTANCRLSSIGMIHIYLLFYDSRIQVIFGVRFTKSELIITGFFHTSPSYHTCG